MNLLEFIQKEIRTTINGRVDETAKRDYKKEYEKYGKSEKAKKYRAELNKYNRDKGTYGNGDGKDASHKGGKIVGFESEKKNRGRAEKSRLKKEHHGDDFPKELLSGSLSDILDKLSKIDKEDYNDVEDILKKHFKNDEVVENLLEKCWKGYKIHPKRKTKKLFGKTYPNCVKNEDIPAKKVELKEFTTSILNNFVKKSKDLDDFIKIVTGKYKSFKGNEKFLNFLNGFYKLATESVNEVKKYKKGDKLKIKLKNGKQFDLTFHSYGKQKGMAFGNFDGDTKPFSLDTIKEQKLDEKLITFSNRAAYGQVVFMAGGAGSGKGFAKDNFIDAAGFKVRDVDEMKKAVGKLDQLKKFSIDKWYKKYGKKLSTKPPKKNPKGMSAKEHIEEFVLGKGLTISDISKDLKNPTNVASLHYIVDAMGLKDKWLIAMLSGKENKETLPNLLFDITAKKVSSITDVIKPLMDAGYDSNNVHLIWVLTNYQIAVDRNKDRDRVVPDDILLDTHEGAGKTVWSVLTKVLPKGLNGRIDVILNNSENTIYHIQPSIRKSDDDGKKFGMSKDLKGEPKKVGVVSNFVSLPVKTQGGGIVPEKVWKSQLYSWIRKNAPATLDLDQTINKSEK